MTSPSSPGRPRIVARRKVRTRLLLGIRAVIALGIFSILAAMFVGLSLYVQAARDLPPLDCFEELVQARITPFEAADGQLVGWRYRDEGKRLTVRWDQIPRKLILALVAVEDHAYFWHGGVSITGVARAAITGKGGGSSLTQQLAKDLFKNADKDNDGDPNTCEDLTEPGVSCQKRCHTHPWREACLDAFEPDGQSSLFPWGLARRLYGDKEEIEDSESPGKGLCRVAGKFDEILGRKVPEAVMARRMEDMYTKQQILLWYLNRKFFGNRCYGIQTAAHHYFGRDVWELSLAQMTMLVGMLPEPSRANPVNGLEKARSRMKTVLAAMKRHEWLTPEEHDQALAEGMSPDFQVKNGRSDYRDHVPYYTSHVFKQVNAHLGLAEDDDSWLNRGLTVSMHVEPAHQITAARALGDALERLGYRQGYPGPLGAMDREAFLTASAPYLSWGEGEPALGTRLLGRVTKRTKDTVTVELTRDLVGTLRLEDNRWAGPYTEGKKLKGGGHKGVTLNPRLKDMRKAFSPGDVVYVEVLRQEGERIDLELVPIPLMEGALVSFPVISGGVDTLVGGWDFDRNQTRRYLSDTRQVASTMKPIYYSLRYDQGMSPSTDLSGASFSGHGYDGHGKGQERVIAWEALLRSRDTSSQRVWSAALRATCQGAKPEEKCDPKEKYRDWAERMGFDDVERLLDAWGNEALGGNSQAPLAMARAYGTLAGRGRAPRMPLVRKITDRDGRILERNIQPLDPHASFAETITALWDLTLDAPAKEGHTDEPRALGRRPPQQIPPVTAFLTTANLVEVVKRGTGRRFRRPLPTGKRSPMERTTKRLKREAAGKTGTLEYDVWFDGFTYDRTAVVWIGADNLERTLGNSTKTSGVSAANTALPAWTDFMAEVHGDSPVQEMTEKHAEPIRDQVGRIHVNPETGLVPPCDCRPRTPCGPKDGVPIYVRADATLDCEEPEEEGDQISEDDL